LDEITSKIVDQNNLKTHSIIPIRFNYTVVSESINSFDEFEVKPLRIKSTKADKSKYTVDIYFGVREENTEIKLTMSYNNNKYIKSRMKGLMEDYMKIVQDQIINLK
jgi:hypothetical protein